MAFYFKFGFIIIILTRLFKFCTLKYQNLKDADEGEARNFIRIFIDDFTLHRLFTVYYHSTFSNF